jgi:uncharacterized protein
MKDDRFTGGLIVFALLLLAGAFFIPWRHVTWGKFALMPASTITVTGEARSEQKSQVASFTAGVTAVDDSKEKAVESVNETVTTLTESVKEFGIPAADIKTQNLSVYRMEEPIYKDGRQRMEPGQWRVSNDITIRLRDIDQTEALVNLLNSSGATNVYGPNFAIDDTNEAEVALLSDAIENARQKAQAIADGSQKTLGGIINVQEGYASSPIPMYALRGDMGGGGGAPVEPGTQTISKSVTVTFELE